jgi:hypothetical protein
MTEQIDIYPTIEQVEQADHEQICRWYRFLRCANNSDEVTIINLVHAKWCQFGGTTPEISKRIGW